MSTKDFADESVKSDIGILAEVPERSESGIPTEVQEESGSTGGVPERSESGTPTEVQEGSGTPTEVQEESGVPAEVPERSKSGIPTEVQEESASTTEVPERSESGAPAGVQEVSGSPAADSTCDDDLDDEGRRRLQEFRELETLAFVDDYVTFALKDRDFMWTGCCLEKAYRYFDIPFYKRIRELSKDYRIQISPKFARVSVRLFRSAEAITKYVWAFADVLFAPGFSYCRLTAFLVFGGELAYYCVYKRHEEYLPTICAAMAAYILVSLHDALMAAGGYPLFADITAPNKVFCRPISGVGNVITSSRSGILQVHLLAEEGSNGDDEEDASD